MKTKIIIAFIIVSAIMLFSMQLCTMIFGNKPVVIITEPTENSIITGTSLTVKGTITDVDGDASKVKVFIEDTSASGWDYSVSSGYFEVTLTLTNFENGRTYHIVAEGYDANNNVSQDYIVNVIYSSSGGGGTNTNAPTLDVTTPINEATIISTILQVMGTATDSNGDLKKVTAWIENTNIIESYTSFTNSTSAQNFTIDLTLSTLSNGQYTLKVQAEDYAGNKSNIISKTFNYSVGTSANILLNGNFSQYYDNYSGPYTSQALIDTYLNKTTGDYLANWQFYIDPDSGISNGIKIDLNGSSVRYYSTQSFFSGNRKLTITQYFNQTYTITVNTKLYIKFKIDHLSETLASNPGEAPIKIRVGINNSWSKLIASYSSGNGDNNGVSLVSNIPLNVIKEYDFNVSLNSIDVIEPGTQIDFLQIFVNIWSFDATIYEIRLYEP